ncbi:Down syndrome cell adhesion molecule-like protein Dscam2 [Araneus ventricosus]|uniref:Down syndrome cell adhesion molecule-like protein Dscam2 n=2 Tax=Araneus ventricosus TaxID=182803 RepID=A0A4Y2RCF5_ARAVE|nr:Down syndrome cell adhesion molecule-like protein Dscam2 [Araneus ventricosus]
MHSSPATVCFYNLFTITGACDLNRKDARGPVFRMEPPSRVEFSNNSGTELRCSADGYPAPRLTWLTREGTPARDVPGLRHTRSDGTLVFSPFPRSEYRQDVHDAVYQCSASNPVGVVLSREVHVRGGMCGFFWSNCYKKINQFDNIKAYSTMSFLVKENLLNGKLFSSYNFKLYTIKVRYYYATTMLLQPKFAYSEGPRAGNEAKFHYCIVQVVRCVKPNNTLLAQNVLKYSYDIFTMLYGIQNIVATS